jgi:transglutaminase-like putative cysteine protease
MTRRDLLAGTGALLVAPARAASQWLQATRHIDYMHPEVQRTAATLIEGLAGETQRAIAIHAFVRDRIRFGFSAGFWDMPASRVLKVGVGYCNTKSTLFVALLRACAIPARQRFMDIDAAILSGLIDPGTPFVDHSTVEVFLSGEWVQTDSYIVDRPLLRAATARLDKEGKVFGYGAHRLGSDVWNGSAGSYAQYNRLSADRLGTREWGHYADVAAFYDRADGTWNRLNPLVRAGFGMAARGANARAEQLRRTAG